MRIEQPEGTRGSLKWIQRAVQEHPQLLQPSAVSPIRWLSPLREDGFAEYRDGAFLDLIGQGHLQAELRDFWPQRGPQWDGLGETSEGPILVEAKAHIKEFYSPPSQAKGASAEKIARAFARVGDDLGVAVHHRWQELYYQYANRIAFLWWLRSHGVAARLIFVSFLNDTEMAGPDRAEIWETSFAAANYALGLKERHRLSGFIHHVYPDVKRLS